MASHIFDQKKMMYIHSLLNETMPLSLLTDDLRGELLIDEMESFGLVHILYNNAMQNSIEAKDSADVADWKAAIHEHMLRDFDAPIIHYSCVLNLAPYTRTIVYSFDKKNLSLMKDHIKYWYQVTKDYLQDTENAAIMAFANPQIIPFEKIGYLYKELRQLQNYQYVIGMDTLTFYDDFDFRDDYTVTEYKYIQRFENLLNNKGYHRLTFINKELTVYIRDHVMNDSKVIYLYKELMSVVIRHLYSQETKHLKLIETLNHAINDFPNRFNDLTEVANYIHHLLLKLGESEDNNDALHPQIRKVLAIIEKGYHKDLTLDAIADQLSLSDAYLSRLFKDNMAISFKQYLTKYRMNVIKKLLTHTSEPIKKIAESTGYQSANQLTRIFKKYEKMTPREYRQYYHQSSN